MKFKRIIAFLLSVVLLLGLSACSSKGIKDTFSTGLKWGNHLVAEQGNWIALRGEKGGKIGLLLGKKSSKSRDLLVEGDVTDIAMLSNKIYFRFTDSTVLNCYDMATEKYTEICSDVAQYQVHQNTIYYSGEKPGKFINTCNIKTKKTEKIELKFTADDFWITDYALYYLDEEEDYLIVKDFETNVDKLLYRGVIAHCRDVVSLDGGPGVAFLKESALYNTTALCTYNRETFEVTEHLSGNFDRLNVYGNHLVVLKDDTVLAVEFGDGHTHELLTLEEEYDDFQLLSDCIILYNGNKATVKKYPKVK